MADDLHTLSAPYALDALTSEERQRYEEHLETCEQCRDELAGLQEAAASLAFVVEGPAPPSALRTSILGAARAERPNVVPLRPRSTFASVAAALAVAASAAAVGFGVWAASLHDSLAHSRVAVRVLGDPASRHLPVGGGRGELVVAPSGNAVLAVRLPKLTHGKTYEAWIADPNVRRAGQFDGGAFTLPRRVARGAQVMVTVERSGGVDAPTSKPLFAVRA
ncbi:MAG TPA: anti-sigma factor [Gaiellaceae bacterium]|nr:anti-sigma factor [Gaiellaceae bacterium]